MLSATEMSGCEVLTKNTGCTTLPSSSCETILNLYNIPGGTSAGLCSLTVILIASVIILLSLIVDVDPELVTK